VTEKTSAETIRPARTEHSYRVYLPRFVSDQEVGLGDVMTQATALFGIRPCGGCEQRAAALNRWMVFSGRHSR
jgi:hypothetical protein